MVKIEFLVSGNIGIRHGIDGIIEGVEKGQTDEVSQAVADIWIQDKIAKLASSQEKAAPQEDEKVEDAKEVFKLGKKNKKNKNK